MAHLSDDETVAKMGHPNLDMGHPAKTFQKIIGLPPVDYRRRFGTGDRIAN
jgi:hypothetical protein